MIRRDRSNQKTRRPWPLLLAMFIVGTRIGTADATDITKSRDLCDDVPQNIPKDVDEDGTFEKMDSDERDWTKRINACYALIEAEDPDPDIYYYVGRLELMEGYRDSAGLHFRRGAEAGSVKAMTALGYYQWSTHHDLQAMVSWYKKAAERGDPMAQTALGMIYSGLAFEWAGASEFDRERARGYLEAAAAQGDPVAHLMLGSMAWPENEQSDVVDLNKALNHVKIAARAGLPQAQRMLREKGYDVPDTRPDARWPPTMVPSLRMMQRP